MCFCLQLKCQLFFFELATNQKFDIGIMLVILLNMATMSIEHYDEPQRLTDVLHYINTVFIAVFTLECAVKLVGLRWYYFREPWNVFDFTVVIISILGIFCDGFFISKFREIRKQSLLSPVKQTFCVEGTRRKIDVYIE